MFHLIRNKLPAHVSFVHELSELLNISYDSAYRRIRGEKELNLEELKRLSEHFNISLDTLFNVSSRNILFNAFAVDKEDYTLEDWMKNILEEMRDIQTCKQKEILWSAKDIPPFHFFGFPELAAFKSYFWNKVLFNTPGFEKMPFRFDLADGFEDTGRQILSIYNKIPSSEIWNMETFISLIRQIEFCHVCHYFTGKEDALKVLDALERLVDHLDQQAGAGFRYLYGDKPEGIEGSYRLYYNEVLLGDNTIFVIKDGHPKTFLTYNVINLLVTEHEKLCSQIENSMRTVIKKSTLISSTSEKERNRFFQSLFGKIREIKSQIS